MGISGGLGGLDFVLEGWRLDFWIKGEIKIMN